MKDVVRSGITLLLAQLAKFISDLDAYVVRLPPGDRNEAIADDVVLIRSYEDQLRLALRDQSLRGALQASNRTQSINKGLGDRVWTSGQPRVGEAASAIQKTALRLSALLVEELGGFDVVYGDRT